MKGGLRVSHTTLVIVSSILKSQGQCRKKGSDKPGHERKGEERVSIDVQAIDAGISGMSGEGRKEEQFQIRGLEMAE